MIFIFSLLEFSSYSSNTTCNQGFIVNPLHPTPNQVIYNQIMKYEERTRYPVQFYRQDSNYANETRS